jgi:dolichol-phosphate mannosyltransferase
MIHNDLISIIMPIYKEQDNIKQSIQKINKVIKYPYEILVIYDFDEDETVTVVKQLQKTYKHIILIKNVSSGLISAVKTGIKNAKGEVIVIMSTDLSDDPETINAMFKQIKSGAMIVSATRYSNGGKRYDTITLKYLLSRIVGITTPWILGIPTTDLTNGFKMYNIKVFSAIPIRSVGGWEFTMEILIKANLLKYKIVEIPTISHKRRFGASKFKLIKWLPHYIHWYIWGVKNRFSKDVSFTRHKS